MKDEYQARLKAKILEEVEEMIDSIYDEFETRICRNCIHYNIEDESCANVDSVAHFTDRGVLDCDGCNCFTRK